MMIIKEIKKDKDKKMKICAEISYCKIKVSYYSMKTQKSPSEMKIIKESKLIRYFHKIIYISEYKNYNEKYDTKKIMESYIEFINKLDKTCSHDIYFTRICGIKERKEMQANNSQVKLIDFIEEFDALISKSEKLNFAKKTKLTVSLKSLRNRCNEMIYNLTDYKGDSLSEGNINEILRENMQRINNENIEHVDINVKIQKTITNFNFAKIKLSPGTHILNMDYAQIELLKEEMHKIKNTDIITIKEKIAKNKILNINKNTDNESKIINTNTKE